ncbi:transposase [Crossiella sp. CA198]|uniref:transposase n=1 Tax=Crossiella sp. CA198 TaxID=3455607 RepID=UPI003F8D0217
MTARADALFELADAVLCADGPVTSLVDLTPEHRRGHGARYDGLNSGPIDVARLRVDLACLPLPGPMTGGSSLRWA